MPLLIDFINRQFVSSPPPVTTSFAGRTIIVTGGSSGLGLEAVRLLASLRASRIILAVRNPEKGQAAVSSIRASLAAQKGAGSKTEFEVWSLDLTSFASVLAFSDRCESLPRIDALILNAGIWPKHFRRTRDGHEESLQTNVLASALLACALCPALAKTAKLQHCLTHITVVGSELYEFAAFKERNTPQILAALNGEKLATKNMGDRYNTTKLMVTLVMRAMVERLPRPKATVGVVIDVIAPGLCFTNLGQQDVKLNAAAKRMLKAIARKPEVGARTLVYGACAPATAHGGYLPDCNLTAVKGQAAGEAGKKLQDRVWVEVGGVLEGLRKDVTGIGLH